MTPNLSAARIYTDFQGFSELKAAARNNSPEALKEVAIQFEALFIQMMLKSMRDASLSDGIFESDQSELYLGLFDQQVAIDMAAKQSFGIAEMLMRQLGEHNEDKKDGVAVNEIPATLKADDSEHINDSVIHVRNNIEHNFANPEEFVEYMQPLAEQAANRLGIAADVLLAQAALETGWGKRVIRDQQGHSSFNLFGIKSDKRWDGPEVNVRSLEYINGVARKKVSAFRVYGSYQQSFADYVDFIQQNSHYRDALSSGNDAHDYIKGLHKAGYATDPQYAEKVIEIMDRVVM